MSSEVITRNDLIEILNEMIPIDKNAYLIGEIKAYAGNTVPNGWLLCDGSEVLIESYPLLYAIIGGSWGTASDNEHFVLPNLNGRVPVGYDTSQTDFDTVGKVGGNKYIQAHTHGFTNPTIPSHAHAFTGNLDDSSSLSGSNPSPRGAVMRRGSGNTWTITNTDGGGGRTSGGSVGAV